MRQKRNSMRGEVGTASFVGALLLGCVLSGCWGAATDSMSDANGSGGASVGTGGSASGGPATGGAASGGTIATMTKEEWRAATAPVSGPHEIWTYDTCDVPHAGSESMQIGQGYSIIPPIGHTTAPDYDAEENPVFLAVLVPYCVTSADCTQHAGGICHGRIMDAYCDYPEPPDIGCRADAECTALPGGSCLPPPAGYIDYPVCDPTGACEPLRGKCIYPGDAPCTADTDCTAASGGKCILPVMDPICRYGSCTSDEDCTDGERCGCGFCAQADCSSDESCPDGETCEFSDGSCNSGFFCSTPEDFCTAGEAGCFYDELSSGEGAWGPQLCLIK